MSDEVEFEWEESPELDKLRALLEQDDEWSIEFRTPYAGYIEFGTGPSHEPGARAQYWPKLAPLEAWVNRQLGITGKEGERVARAIQHKLHEEGMRPKPFARPAVDDAKARIGEILARNLSMGDVMQYIANQARRHITENGTIDNGYLRARIFVVHGKEEG